jgi:hypothetical protein
MWHDVTRKGLTEAAIEKQTFSLFDGRPFRLPTV